MVWFAGLLEVELQKLQIWEGEGGQRQLNNQQVKPAGRGHFTWKRSNQVWTRSRAHNDWNFSLAEKSIHCQLPSLKLPTERNQDDPPPLWPFHRCKCCAVCMLLHSADMSRPGWTEAPRPPSWWFQLLRRCHLTSRKNKKSNQNVFFKKNTHCEQILYLSTLFRSFEIKELNHVS